MLTYLLAVLASGANATASVLQRKANLQVPRKQNLSPRLIGTLLHEPVWFGGVLAVFAGFLLQASAVTTAATQMKRLLRQDKQLVSRPIRLALGYWPTRTRR